MALGSSAHPWPTAVAVLIALLAAGLVASPARAQQDQPVTVSAQAHPMTAGTSDVVTFTIRVEGAPLSMVDTPEPPSTANLALRRPTPTTQRNVSVVDGRLDRSITFRWEYEPMRTGTARFGPVTVSVRGRTYKTETIRVDIMPQSQRPARPPSGRAIPHGGVSPSASDGRPTSALGEDDLFIRALPSDRQIYQNEQTVITYRLYFREGIQLRHSRLATAWDATGFWREELDVESRPLPRTAYVDGTPYQTIVLKRVALFPTRTGTLDVDPLEIETEARASAQLRTPNDPFSSLRRSYETVTLSSEPLTIDVQPLPGGAPEAFRGAVGSFQIRTEVDSRDVATGRALRMTVRLRGTGNIATLEPPGFTPPDAVDAYDPETTTSIDRSGRSIQGTKAFTYVLIPRRNGELTLPPVTFAYFNPEQRRYETLQSAPLTIDVAGSETPTATSTTGRGLPANDIAAPLESADDWIRTDAPPLYLNPWTYVALLTPLLLAGGLLALRRGTSTAPDAPPPSDDDRATQQLHAAREYLRTGNPDAFYGALEQAVLGCIGDYIGARPAGLTRSRIDQALGARDVPARIRQAIFELLDVCDRVRYTPAQPAERTMQQALQRTHQILDYLHDRRSD